MGTTPVRPKVLLAACGGVASLKFEILCRLFTGWTDVIAIVTKPALHFIKRESLPPNMTLYTDEVEWANWSRIGDPILHIQLQRWADMMVIAPLTANTLAKMAGGQCDNLLTCTLRAWDYSKPIFIAPGMNVNKWRHPLTEQHLMSIEQFGSINYVPGELGVMAEPEQIFAHVVHYFNRIQANQAGGSGSQGQTVPDGSDGEGHIQADHVAGSDGSDGEGHIQVDHVAGSGGEEEAVPSGNDGEEEEAVPSGNDGEEEEAVPSGNDGEEEEAMAMPIGSDGEEEGEVPIGSDGEGEEEVPIDSDGEEEEGLVPIGSDGEEEGLVPIGSDGEEEEVVLSGSGGEEVMPSGSGSDGEVGHD